MLLGAVTSLITLRFGKSTALIPCLLTVTAMPRSLSSDSVKVGVLLPGHVITDSKRNPRTHDGNFHVALPIVQVPFLDFSGGGPSFGFHTRQSTPASS